MCTMLGVYMNIMMTFLWLGPKENMPTWLRSFRVTSFGTDEIN